MANTTWNPSDLINVTLSGGNLIALSTANTGGVRGVDGATSGKGYVEFTYTTISTNSFSTGFELSTASLQSPTTGSVYVARSTGNIIIGGSPSGSTLTIIAPAAVIGVAVDLNGKLIWFRKAPSGSWNGNGSADPATGVGGLSISVLTTSAFPLFSGGTSDKVTANFGGSVFSGTVPSGFTAGWPPGSSVRNGPIVTMIG